MLHRMDRQRSRISAPLIERVDIHGEGPLLPYPQRLTGSPAKLRDEQDVDPEKGQEDEPIELDTDVDLN